MLTLEEEPTPKEEEISEPDSKPDSTLESGQGAVKMTWLKKASIYIAAGIVAIPVWILVIMNKVLNFKMKSFGIELLSVSDKPEESISASIKDKEVGRMTWWQYVTHVPLRFSSIETIQRQSNESIKKKKVD